jgi:hypothetical protein
VFIPGSYPGWGRLSQISVLGSRGRWVVKDAVPLNALRPIPKEFWPRKRVIPGKGL